MEENKISLLGDYHTHTIYSSSPKPSGKHAKGTIRENVEAAYRAGLEEIAITEHGPSHYFYGVREKYIDEMRDEIEKLKDEFGPKGLNILLGMEANIIGLDGKIDVSEGTMKKLDFLVMGYHYGAMPKGVKDGLGLYFLNPVSKFIKLGLEKATELNTLAYLKSMDRYPIDMISHPGSKAPIYIEEVGKKAEEMGIILEISSKHSELSIESLEKLKGMNISYRLNSDAHRPEDVGNISIGLDKAIKSGMDLSLIDNIRIL